MSNAPTWDELQAFWAVIEVGSLSAAARRLGLSQPTLRSRIDTLERRLDAVLFTRSAAGLTPTESARAMAAHVGAMQTASQAVLRAASGTPGAIAGAVRVSVSEFVGAVVLPPMLARLRARHPAVCIELAPSNAAIDLARQEADIAVRMYPPHGDGLVARKIGAIRLGFYAARSYAARRGLPAGVEDLAAHDLIGPDRSAYDARLIAAFHPTLAGTRFVLRSDSHVAHLAAIRAGLGIGVIQRGVADCDPALVAVLPERDFATLETWIVVHDDLRRAPKVRAVFDWLVDEMTAFAR
ncbi:LysR family transcriptional regulator [Novosphingobium album (ex Liu et al. 2023)]|uniref:LysR family transcriptional regulator n=1 Tax=Novosphingobium album (ex Liu et al. 2023) TaxID=3031130 RepID=A0ABT5WV97_9SPHN|nr:LysR family transcriptional regulator [Novosphingobium album (ex Liu et al. 2023)]MDE8653774.1 LysR family transcriptional regulator [Novosphingobium album (ex Liu et al. 2023)]